MKAITEHSDYREILKDELQRRSQGNPRYSQGAFARDLHILPSRLSEVLNGKQGLSARTAREIAGRLGFAKGDVTYFTDLVMSQHGRSRSARQAARLRLKRLQKPGVYSALAEDHFRVISEWYHLAIVELAKLRGFRSEPQWIADALAISREEADSAIQRLIRVRLLRMNGGRLEPMQSHNFVSSEVPSDSIRAFHSQMLDKARASLLSDPLPDRENQSYIVAIDERRLPELRRKIIEWARELDIDISQTSEPNEWTSIYCLTTHLFRLTQGASSHPVH